VAVTIAAGRKRLLQLIDNSSSNLKSIAARAAALMSGKDERVWRRTHANITA
jgi:hypothetical protein